MAAILLHITIISLFLQIHAYPIYNMVSILALEDMASHKIPHFLAGIVKPTTEGVRSVVKEAVNVLAWVQENHYQLPAPLFRVLLKG